MTMIWLMIGCLGTETQVNKLVPDLAVSADTIDFGEVKVDEQVIETIQLINAGQSTLNLSAISIFGEGALAYTVVYPESTIPINGIMDVDIAFQPADLIPYSGTLSILSDDEEFPDYQVSISGSGGLGPLPDIELDTESLDFGDVYPGNESLLFFNLTNAGDADLIINSTDQSGSGAFSILTDVDGQTIAPGASTSVLVNYQPFQEEGDSGSLTINSNDTDEGEAVVTFIGNGGGEFAYPEAILGCPNNVTLPSSVNVNGANSTDPNGETLSYAWSLDQQPIGSTSVLQPNINNNAVSLDLDVAGTYRVGLVVTNESGIPSPAAECLIEALPPSDVYAELSWSDTQSDFDLHLLLQPDGLFQFDSDCCWCNASPSWFTDSSQNPILQQDSQDGSIAEVIDLAVAPDGEYYFRVHYFSDNGAGTADATIRIYIEGVLTGQYTQSMTHNQVWDVGFVRWPSRVLAEELSEPYALSTSRSCQ